MNTHQDKKKAIGFNLGQRGDLIMNTVALKAYKAVCPDSHFTFAIGPQYADMIPLFQGQPDIDEIHVFSSYDGWPNTIDTEYLQKNKFNHIFNGMPNHTSFDWWRKYHQCQELLLMHGLPDIKDYKCSLIKWFSTPRYTKTVAFAPFAGYYNKDNNKKLSVKKAQEIVFFLISLGYDVLQLGGKDEPALEQAIKHDVNYFESVKNMLGCDFLLATDTGLRWVASAYDFPTIGLDSDEIYNDKISSIQPINKNSIYISSKNCNDITIDSLKNAIINI